MISSLAIGIVVATYPEGNSIDVLLADDGSRLSNVQVMVPSGSSNTGIVDLPDVGLPADESRWDIKGNPERRIRAVLALCRGVPVCIGFLLPQENQVSFKQKNRRVMRHASDVYTSIDADGNAELFHPSGTYLRIGTAAAHEDLTGQDFDKLWAISKNASKSVHVQLTVANGGQVRASLNIAPNGNITLTHDGNLSIQTDGNATVNVGGNAELTADAVEINGPTTINGDVTVNGGVQASEDVVAGSISLQQHTHTGVQSGGSSTGPPQ